jgi:hypothetical protein
VNQRFSNVGIDAPIACLIGVGQSGACNVASVARHTFLEFVDGEVLHHMGEDQLGCVYPLLSSSDQRLPAGEQPEERSSRKAQKTVPIYQIKPRLLGLAETVTRQQ